MSQDKKIQSLQKNKLFCKENIPNFITFFRIILVPIVVSLLLLTASKNDKIVYSLSYKDYFISNIYMFQIIAGVLFVLAAITDWLDGFLSRKYNWVSNFGKIWDPLADKLLINTVLICFAIKGWIPAFLLILMIIRDLIVDGYRIMAANKQIVVPANIYGKLKTVAQMFAIIFIFFAFSSILPNLINDKIIYIFYYLVQNLSMIIATILSVISGIIYIININRLLKDVHKQ